jgi:hypothetical protein
VNHSLQYDYTAVGHVTIDVLEDGARRAGGTAFYSALQAARLGLRTSIVTRGVAAEIEALIAPHRHELHELLVLPAPRTTTLHTLRSGSARTQRVLAWAGPIADDLQLDTAILHLAPVARESPARWSGRAEFVGLTPQGLVRRWSDVGAAPAHGPGQGQGQEQEQAPGPGPGPGALIELGVPVPGALEVARRCGSMVVSEYERESCAGLIATAGAMRAAGAAGAIVAVTDGARPNTILMPAGVGQGGETSKALEVKVPVTPLDNPVDDLGAGDVFAAAFFIALHDGHTALDAARFANAAAAVRMAGEGADAIGGRPAIDARLRSGVGSS